MIYRWSVMGAFTLYQIKRLIKNLYLLLWLGAVMVSVTVVSQYWVNQETINNLEWLLFSVNTGMLGAYLLLPLLARSFMPAFSASGGVEFLAGRTRYLGLDTIITLVIHLTALLLIATGGIWVVAWGLKITLPVPQLLLIILFNALPSLLLLLAIMLVLLTLLPLLLATISFWLLLGGMVLIPNLAPWGGLILLSGGTTVSYSPLMLLNRLFCVLATGLLIYIYILLIKNQGQGLINTKERRHQARLAESKAVILAGRGLVLGNQAAWELIKQEVKMRGYYSLLISCLGSAGWGLLAHHNKVVAITGLGITILTFVRILSPFDLHDQLISKTSRRKWQFIFLRTGFPLFQVMMMMTIFWLLGPNNAAYQVFWGFFMVWGWAWLCSHYWSKMAVMLITSIFWVAIVIFPGALRMTTSNHWWMALAILMILAAVTLYRHQLVR